MADVRSIFSLMMKDNASKQLEAFRKNWQSTTKEIESDGGGGLDDMLGGFVSSGLGKVAAGIGAAFATGAVANMTWELGRASAESMRVAESFDRLAASAGQSGAAMLEAMRSAARGTIDDTSLMLMANRAMTLGVVRNTEEMTSLIEAAIIRGRDMGLSASQAVGDLVTGIGRMSPMILDNLGIVGVTGAIDEYAASLGKTADQLTDVEKKQALLNSVMASVQGVEIVDDAAAAFERMDASISNAKDALGQLFAPAVAAIAQTLADTVNGALNPDTSDMESSAALLGGYFALMGQGAKGAGDAVGWLGGVMADGLGITQASARAQYEQGAAFHDSVYGAQMLAANLAQAAAATGGFAAAQAAAAPAIDAVTKKLLDQAAAARDAIAATAASQSASLRSALIGMSGDMGAGAALNVYTELNAELEARTARMQSWGYTAEQIEFQNAAWTQNQIDRLREQTKAYGSLQTAGTGAASNISSAFNDLQSRVSGVLSGSLNMDVGVDPADYLPREDEINENARRLAAIMRDGMGDQEWMEEFKREVPAIFDEIANSGDPRGAAARILQEFQAGLRPELLDREAVKERVRQMILGEQSMSAMAGEIAQELASEMGLSLQQVQATMGSMGLGGGSGEGDALGEGIAAGVDGNLIASTTITKMAKAFLDNEGQIRTAGGVVGAWWGQGFMAVVGDNVPTGLIDLLAMRVLPVIQAAMAAATSTTGTSDGN